MTEDKRVLVYGANGAQGRPIVERLVANGRRVRALARSGHAPSGAEAARADLDDAEALAAATAGCDRVVFMLPLVFDAARARRWTENALRAAETAGVELLVFDTSAPVPDAAPGVAAIDLKVEAERLVRGSGVPSIVVRPTIYMGNLAAPWSAPAIANDAVVAYPLPEDVAVAWIAWEDAAAAVAAALARPHLAGRAFDVGGPEALDGAGLAAAFSRALGHPHTYAPIPLPGFEAGLNGALGAPVGTEIARLYGFLAGEGRALIRPDASGAAELGVRPVSLGQWATTQDWRALASAS